MSSVATVFCCGNATIGMFTTMVAWWKMTLWQVTYIHASISHSLRKKNGLKLHGSNRNQRLLKIPYNQVVVLRKDTITQQIYQGTQNQDIPGNSWHSLIKKEMLTKTLVTSGNSIYGNLIQLSTSSSATEHTVIPWCAAWVTGSFQLVNTH